MKDETLKTLSFRGLLCGGFDGLEGFGDGSGESVDGVDLLSDFCFAVG